MSQEIQGVQFWSSLLVFKSQIVKLQKKATKTMNLPSLDNISWNWLTWYNSKNEKSNSRKFYKKLNDDADGKHGSKKTITEIPCNHRFHRKIGSLIVIMLFHEIFLK